jgi:hypothetical protein
MIYLIRPPDIAACEAESNADRYLADGYERVDAWRFVYYWSLRDDCDYARLRGQERPQEREVGGWQPSGVLARVGWVAPWRLMEIRKD